MKEEVAVLAEASLEGNECQLQRRMLRVREEAGLSLEEERYDIE